MKNCLNARAKMTSDKFDDELLLARKPNENKMKNVKHSSTVFRVKH